MPRKLLGEFLIEKGLISKVQLKKAFDMQVISGKRIGDILVELGYIERNKLEEILRLENICITEIQIDPAVLSLIPKDFCLRNTLIPIKKEGDVLFVAMTDSSNFVITDDLKIIAKSDIEIVVCPKAEIELAIEKNFEILKGNKDSEKEFKINASSQFDAIVERSIEEVDEAPISKLVSLIISEAFNMRASDIHLEPTKKTFRIRYRIDGVLHEITSPPKRLQGALTSRIKLMAGMDLSEKRLPQDGRIKFTIGGGTDLDLRVSTLPGSHGESVVLRILDKKNLLMGLKELGLAKDDEEKFEKLLNLPNGVILVTGPTGSGKTTTLYSSLNYINRPDKKIITVEDPVEYQITGINQVQIKDKIDLTFSRSLRAILRQAPDVIMIGEIRDSETATITMQAALTGHIVFSTLHTNDAASSIVRLIDMGVAPYLISASVQAIIAQRLVRKICTKCKESYEPLEIEKISIGLDKNLKIKAYKGKGCEYCSYTGYRGRFGIFEMLLINEQIRELIFENCLSSKIREKAREFGMKTLREDGLVKVINGETTISEVLRVTQIQV